MAYDHISIVGNYHYDRLDPNPQEYKLDYTTYLECRNLILCDDPKNIEDDHRNLRKEMLESAKIW